MNFRLLFFLKYKRLVKPGEKETGGYYPRWKIWGQVLVAAFCSIVFFARNGKSDPRIIINLTYVEVKNVADKRGNLDDMEWWEWELSVDNKPGSKQITKRIQDRQKVRYFLDWVFDNTYRGIW